MARWYSKFAFTQRRRMQRRATLVMMAMAALVGCDLYGVEGRDPRPRPSPTGEESGDPSGTESGQAMLRVAMVPEDVQCIRITAAGAARTEEREIDAVAGAMVAETLTGLPLGSVKFLGEA
ncbi:MAG TPA: hypothetical protein VGG33_27345, partial [Polyangia bacterium]